MTSTAGNTSSPTSVVDVVATLTTQPGHAAEVAAMLSSALDTVRAEPGCLRYDLFRVRREDDVLVMVEQWASKDDLRTHGASEHFVELSGRMAPHLAGAPVIRMLDPVAARATS